jgi:hypothetical protein
MARPEESTAMQNVIVEHDTDLREPLATTAGALHVPPLKSAAFPSMSTATQKDGDAHEIELT